MGMLMHHTWLEQQKQDNKPAEQDEKPVVNETVEPEAPAKKTGGRRKTTK